MWVKRFPGKQLLLPYLNLRQPLGRPSSYCIRQFIREQALEKVNYYKTVWKLSHYREFFTLTLLYLAIRNNLFLKWKHID